jgi:putative ABC transport system ATP-binding protein
VTAVARLEGLSRTYPGTPPVEALRPCDLEVEPGDYLAVTGPSGAGKSTLLNLLGLLDTPSGGTYLLDGEDVSRLPEWRRTAVRGRRVGFVFQLFHLLPYRTALENVQLALLYGGVPRGQRPRLAAAALEVVGLSSRLNALPATMSGGERQRVAIARALVSHPALLLCDEPTGNLDSGTTAAILDLLDQLHAEGRTLVVVTHDPQVAARATRQVVIRDGVLTEPAGRTPEPAP